MADIVALEAAAFWFPAWSSGVPSATRVEAQPANFHEDVAVADIDGDVSAVALLAIIKKFLRDEWATIELATFMENVGNGS